MSRYESRQRAADAFALRAANWSWRAIAAKLGYQSVGAVQGAVKAHVEREHREPTEVTQREQVESVRMRSRLLSERFAAAYTAGDDDQLVTINRELHRNSDMIAKLTGTYVPEKHDVTIGRSPAELRASARDAALAALEARQPAGGALATADPEPPLDAEVIE